jgi:hypothetical protein
MDDRLRDRIIGAGAEISQLPHAFVDRGIGQGRQAIMDHLDPLPAPATVALAAQPRYASLTRETPAQQADRVIAGIAAYLSELDAWLAPHQLPEDYRFFISYYGGLAIDDPSYYVDIFGYGPKATARYDIPMDGDQSLYEHGWLAIGSLSLKDDGQPHDGHLVHFFIDLAGNVQRGCVIALPTWGCYESIRDPRVILHDAQAHKDCWTRVAGSFTDWLDVAARTRGAFGYTRSKTAA